MTTANDHPMPLFYRKPQPLVPVIHDDVRLKDGDFSFAADTNALPVTIVEFAQAMRFYPIVFADGGNFPVAVLGLAADNRFVIEGRWADRHYVPAYARRYPFVFVDAGAQGFALALDMASERVATGGDEGVKLFEDGKPAPPTEGALGFCREFHQAHVQTQAFIDALVERDLLIDQRADATLPGGEPRRLGGFRVIDREKFGQLPDDVILDWHHKGWLALILFHITSLDRFAELLALEGVSAPAEAAPNETVAEPATI